MIASRYTYSKTPEVIKDIEEFLVALTTKNFSADNITAEQSKQNHSLVKKVEKILEYQNVQEVQEYFNRAEMSSEFLTNYLYHLQSLASYYMFNMHDGSKAERIILYGKNLAENYVNARSNIKSDFNRLTNAEIFSELQIVKDLPELYTKIIYSLGRIYFYGNTDITASQRYFELSKYLGTRLGLFEGYLSDISGILIIQKDLANSNIKEGNIEIAKQMILHVIESYAEMRNDSTTYILDYNPNSTEQQTLIPKNQLYNFYECGSKIITSYNILLTISKNAEEIREYIDNIERYLVGDKSLKGIFEIIENVPQKKIAVLYNILGNTMLTLWKLKEQDNIDVRDEHLKKNLVKILPSDDKRGSEDNLYFAEELFSKAKDISRNNDFTKADAYEGLSQVYRFRLEHVNNNLTGKKKQELQNKLNQAIETSNQLNHQLNRKKK